MENENKVPKKMGIYKIINQINHKIYVGSAKNMQNRWHSHKKCLRKQNHHNKHLQSAANKYGLTNFSCEILEIVENENELVAREQYWLDFLKPYIPEIGYNKNKLATSSLGVKHTIESRKNMSIAAKNRKTQPRYEDYAKSKLNWNIISEIRDKYASGEYNSVELGKIYNISDRYVRKILKGTVWNDGRFLESVVKKPDLLNENQISIVLEMLKNKKSWREISLTIGHEYRHIKKFLANKNILFEYKFTGRKNK